MVAHDTAPQVRRNLGRWVRRMRRYLRGDVSVAPSQDVLCLWIELAVMLECFSDAIDLAAHLYETEADEWLYSRAQRLVRLARMKVGSTNGG